MERTAMTQGSMAMSDPSFAPLEDEPSDDLPRTFRREKEARAREAMERAAQERAAAPSLSTGLDARFAPPLPQVEPRADAQPVIEDMPYPAAVRRFDVPFAHLVTFFLKAVVAAIPALILLGVILWFMGGLLQAVFPDLVRMRIIFSFPN
ncbi:MAG: hypothetical protein ACT4OU_07380 [Hyphomicrobium sp.]